MLVVMLMILASPTPSEVVARRGCVLLLLSLFIAMVGAVVIFILGVCWWLTLWSVGICLGVVTAPRVAGAS